MSRITDIAKTMKTWWNEDDDPFVHRALDEIIRIDQEQLPTIEPKRGEWTKEKRVYGVSKPFCSRCGAVALSEMINLGSYKTCESNFCPNCGARMKGADDEH